MAELFYTPDRSGLDLWFTPDFTAGELAERRQRIASEIGPDARLLIVGAPPLPREGLGAQDANFYYFTGIETCGCYLLVDGGTARSQLFMPSRDTIPGEDENKLGFEDADLIKQRLGFDHVAPSTELTEALRGTKLIRTPFAEFEGDNATLFAANGCANRRAEDEWDAAEPRHKRLIRLLEERLPGVKVEDAMDLIKEMRTIKSPAEVEVMRQAGKLAAAAVNDAMRATHVGTTEAHLHGVGDYVYRSRGHCDPAYGWIVAGGTRTWDGHYHYNNATLNDGDVVLMDCGPDLRHYTSDIARVWPVNGTFSDWHRRTCGFLLAYHKALLGEVRAGVMPQDVYDRADAKMASLCTEPGSPWHDRKWLFDQMVERSVGYLNHGVGLSVHDAIGRWRDVPLREGFVVVCDPMAWCEDRHEYLRVEDTLVVTADGCEVLTADAPIELDEIEAMMR